MAIMNTRSVQNLSHLSPGKVYRRSELLSCSRSIDRDLTTRVKQKKLVKAGVGLYYKPVKSRFGALPPDERKLVRAFLLDEHFLLFSRNQYNALGLGLTQVYNRTIVYNRKRHGVFTLTNREFDFRRPLKGFPRLLTKEFLLVDLVNHLKELSEDSELIKARIRQKLNTFDQKRLKRLAKQYGKVATVKFFRELLNE